MSERCLCLATMPRHEMDYKGSGIIKQEMSVQDENFKAMVSKTDKPPQILNFGCPDRASGVLPLFHVSAPSYNTVFTESQWMELEHQALIYKYMAANVPIPSNLLLPIRRAVESSRLSGFPSSLIRQTPFGFHFGNTDPEPGRCRRTDGKKWRCSRDAVQDQKYCERHINRGRNRSRKPVEDQSGHSDTSLKRFASSTSAAKVSTSVHINFQPPCPDGVSRLSKGSSGNSAVYCHNVDETALFHKMANGWRADSIGLSWDGSVGGPLGEALNSGSSTKSDE